MIDVNNFLTFAKFDLCGYQLMPSEARCLLMSTSGGKRDTLQDRSSVRIPTPRDRVVGLCFVCDVLLAFEREMRYSNMDNVSARRTHIVRRIIWPGTVELQNQFPMLRAVVTRLTNEVIRLILAHKLICKSARGYCMKFVRGAFTESTRKFFDLRLGHSQLVLQFIDFIASGRLLLLKAECCILDIDHAIVDRLLHLSKFYLITRSDGCFRKVNRVLQCCDRGCHCHDWHLVSPFVSGCMLWQPTYFTVAVIWILAHVHVWLARNQAETSCDSRRCTRNSNIDHLAKRPLVELAYWSTRVASIGISLSDVIGNLVLAVHYIVLYMKSIAVETNSVRRRAEMQSRK